MTVFPESLLKSFDLCIRCGACNHVCPIFISQDKKEFFGPRAYLQIPRIVEEELEISVDFIEYAYECTICGICDEVCPVGIPISRLVLAVREALIDQGYVPPPKVASMPTKLSEEGLAFGSRELKARWLPPDYKPSKGDTFFFATCLSSEAPESAVAAFHILRRFMEIETIGREELCCGAFLKLAGYKYLSEGALEEFTSQMRTSEARKIVVLSRPCLDFIQRLKDIEAIHVVDAIREGVEAGELKFNVSKKGLRIGIVGYCDSYDLNCASVDLISQIKGVNTIDLPPWTASGIGSLLSFKAGAKGIRGHFLKLLQLSKDMKLNSLVFVDSSLYIIAREIAKGKFKVNICDVPQFLSKFL
ncbi:MAG TPA: (Fe-S)-binding protein [Candidatus Korarchaeota archaeon]|nr:(Fe-S)-binding protein [Candidatus Korarchaeota archaeon]